MGSVSKMILFLALSALLVQQSVEAQMTIGFVSSSGRRIGSARPPAEDAVYIDPVSNVAGWYYSVTNINEPKHPGENGIDMDGNIGTIEEFPRQAGSSTNSAWMGPSDGVDDHMILTSLPVTLTNDPSGAVSMFLNAPIDPNILKVICSFSIDGDGSFPTFFDIVWEHVESEDKLRVLLSVDDIDQFDVVTPFNSMVNGEGTGWVHVVVQQAATNGGIEIWIDGVAQVVGNLIVPPNQAATNAWFPALAGATEKIDIFVIGGLKGATLASPYQGNVDRLKIYDGLFTTATALEQSQRAHPNLTPKEEDKQ